ncbi:hypothetical protein TSST111916_21200 [Tsukamurella strandjordii]
MQPSMLTRFSPKRTPKLSPGLGFWMVLVPTGRKTMPPGAVLMTWFWLRPRVPPTPAPMAPNGPGAPPTTPTPPLMDWLEPIHDSKPPSLTPQATT